MLIAVDKGTTPLLSSFHLSGDIPTYVTKVLVKAGARLNTHGVGKDRWWTRTRCPFERWQIYC